MTITDLLSSDAIQINAHPKNKQEAIEELIDLHDKAGDLVDREEYKNAILAREAQGTTAVEDGIAIPHAKTNATKRPSLSAMTVPAGVDYEAPDGKPSTLLFMIAAPDDGGDTHLDVLSHLVTILMDTAFRKKLSAARTTNEFLELIDQKEKERFSEEVEILAQEDMEGDVDASETLLDEARAELKAEKGQNSAKTGKAVETTKAGKAVQTALADKTVTGGKDAKVGTSGATSKTATNSQYEILAVTACPTGIAHTYMAAEALTNAAKARGIALKAETNGAGGTKNELTPNEISAAKGIIVAADKEVAMDRFDGKPVLIAKAADGINKADALIDAIENEEVPVYHAANSARETNAKTSAKANAASDESFGRKLYKQLMEGVSHMLPFVVAGGIFIALAFLIDSLAGVPQNADFGMGTPVSAWFKTIGGFAFSFMVPILSAYIAQSIADRPGLVVGFVGGFMATVGSTFALPAGDVPSGFLGGLLAGFAGGYLMLGVERLCDKIPESLQGIKQILIYPIAGLGLIGFMMCVVGPFMGLINVGMTDALTWLSDNNFGIFLALLLGAMMAVDMGGPFNKAAYVFGTGMLATGTTAAFQIMAAVMVGGMVPPLAIALSTTFFKNRWTQEERKNGLVNYVMGLSFVTEGAIPYAASDPLHVIPACVVGSAIAGALSWVFGCTLMAPHGGIFVVPVIGNPLLFLLALGVGALSGMCMLALLKKKRV